METQLKIQQLRFKVLYSRLFPNFLLSPKRKLCYFLALNTLSLLNTLLPLICPSQPLLLEHAQHTITVTETHTMIMGCIYIYTHVSRKYVPIYLGLRLNVTVYF